MVKQLISEEEKLLWLSRRDVKEETENEIIATQDQALQTKYLATNLLPTEIESKCRHCK
jgi:hypothetical protein